MWLKYPFCLGLVPRLSSQSYRLPWLKHPCVAHSFTSYRSLAHPLSLQHPVSPWPVLVLGKYLFMSSITPCNASALLVWLSLSLFTSVWILDSFLQIIYCDRGGCGFYPLLVHFADSLVRSAYMSIGVGNSSLLLRCWLISMVKKKLIWFTSCNINNYYRPLVIILNTATTVLLNTTASGIKKLLLVALITTTSSIQRYF